MKVKVPVFVKDPVVSELEGVNPTENVVIDGDDVFLDGPISARVAVLDFDERSGALRPGARFLPPKSAKGTTGSYAVTRSRGATAAQRQGAVSVFGVVHKTIKMFEEEDALGRRVDWAFDGPQLLVVPFAGEWANAFYERDSHSLQFFSFPGPDGRMIHTCYSQDIVAHETGHAILDGVAPDLYDATSPQALAMHEAIADVVAVMSAFLSRTLRTHVLDITGGEISDSAAFSGLAGQFAEGLPEARDYLRNLNNNTVMSPGLVEPHDLSQVLSGALYTIVMKLYDGFRGAGQSADAVPDAPGENSTGKALFLAADRLARFVIRGLDYLPPGDASFADLGRAMVAADLGSFPDDRNQRDWLAREFRARGIVAAERDLDTGSQIPKEVTAAVAKLDLDALVTSDYYAHDFVRTARKLLRVPPAAAIEVRKRLDVTKKEFHHTGPQLVRECLLKVSWTEEEPNEVGGKAAPRRAFRRGTTLAIDWETKRVRALLTTDEGPAMQESRGALLSLLDAEGDLAIGDTGSGPGDELLSHAVQADVIDGVLRVRNAGRMLHMLGGRP